MSQTQKYISNLDYDNVNKQYLDVENLIQDKNDLSYCQFNSNLEN